MRDRLTVLSSPDFYGKKVDRFLHPHMYRAELLSCHNQGNEMFKYVFAHSTELPAEIVDRRANHLLPQELLKDIIVRGVDIHGQKTNIRVVDYVTDIHHSNRNHALIGRIQIDQDKKIITGTYICDGYFNHPEDEEPVGYSLMLLHLPIDQQTHEVVKPVNGKFLPGIMDNEIYGVTDSTHDGKRTLTFTAKGDLKPNIDQVYTCHYLFSDFPSKSNKTEHAWFVGRKW